jgi:DNA-binding MarR family transcriptional regulator
VTVPIATAERETAERLDFVATHLLARASLLVRLLVKQVHMSDISRTEGEVLLTLSSGRRRISELAELEGLAQPTMTLLVRRLEAKGWVRRAGLPDDGRVVIVSITPAGRRVLEDFRTRFRHALRADLEEITEEDLRSLFAATETLGRFVEGLQGKAGR